MSRHHRRHQRFKLRSFYVWHRYMGLSAAAFVLLIAVTGLLLNHTEYFDLDERRIRSDWILDWYGIQAPQDLHAYLADGRYITRVGTRLYLNRTQIEGEYHELHGAVSLDGMFIIATDDTILLTTALGEIIERLQAQDGVPQGIRRMGVARGGTVVAQTAAASYQADNEFLRWAPWQGDLATIEWVQPTAPDPKLGAALQRRYRNQIVPLERVVLDLHSGRFFGQAGPWVFDIAALLLVLLSLSGTFIWFKRKR